jgi:hypothetical protein
VADEVGQRTVDLLLLVEQALAVAVAEVRSQEGKVLFAGQLSDVVLIERPEDDFGPKGRQKLSHDGQLQQGSATTIAEIQSGREVPADLGDEVGLRGHTGSLGQGIPDNNDVDGLGVPEPTGVVKAVFVAVVDNVLPAFVAVKGGLIGDPGQGEHRHTINEEACLGDLEQEAGMGGRDHINAIP